ncbi:hypothetical protein [Arthrobacter sp. 4R501]|uniref:hypothetical protein n=1 Tax=Arthrobacter sp. 4R501 TaxID=2058886 RepID=UPI0015E37CDE|nr:hypothetical protein [Arthrobacter sp. 4R501]
MTLEDMKTQFAGKRVQFVGMMGATDGPKGKVWRVTNRGVWVTFPDGHREQLHPEDLRVI